MAALVTGLIPILRTAADATTTYKCRSLWFGFLCVRLVILFLAELPFSKLDADFTVLLMELFTSHLRSMAQKKSSQVKTDVEMEVQGSSADPKGRMVIDLHRDRGTVAFYLLSIGLRTLVEAWFLYVLLVWNLPALNNGPYNCSTNICSESRICVVRAAPEKRMSVYALASISGMIIVCSVSFCMYSIAHYLCNF